MHRPANMDIITFDQLLAQHPATKLTLLSGNGLSIAANPSFNYDLLASNPNLSDKTKGIIKKLGETNFEKVLETIQTTQTVLDHLGMTDGAGKVRDEYVHVQSDLIGCILDAQPSDSREINVECSGFIRNFGQIFSLSYDLYLRHSIYILNHSLRETFRDGFTRKDIANRRYFVPSDRINLHYLHGGLNLFKMKDDGHGHFFVTYNWSDEEAPLGAKRVVSQVRQLIQSGTLPIFVAHGSGAEKEKQIVGDEYLNHAYEALKRLEGPLLIFGCSIQPNDDHIWRAIASSAVSHVYVSCRTPQEQTDIQYRTQKYLGKKNPVLVDVSGLRVWAGVPPRPAKKTKRATLCAN